MQIAQIIRAAIPDASDDDCDHVLWGRTAYPFKKLTAKDIFRAASGWRRAGSKGVALCDFCNRVAAKNFVCERCNAALHCAEVA